MVGKLQKREDLSLSHKARGTEMWKGMRREGVSECTIFLLLFFFPNPIHLEFNY